MTKTVGNILKSSNVKIEGRFHLNVDPGAHPAPPLRKNPNLPPQVRIVEKHPEFAVLELTCSCGNKSYIRCEYDNARPENSQS
jgi:hypothetical protein